MAISDLSSNQRKKIFLTIFIIGLLLLVLYKKGLLLAATVNNEPITTIELNQKLNNLFKDRVLNQIINEKIIEQEASKKRISVSQGEIDSKIAAAEAQTGGKETFDSLLAQQGLTRSEFINQTKIQALIEKLYSSEATASAEEISKFMEDNKNSPEATDEAKFKMVAEDQIKQQKLSQIFQEKFQSLRQSAKIQIF